MKLKVFTSILIVMALIVAVVLPVMSTGCSSDDETSKVLKIGVMTPATGVAAEKGSAGRAGALDCVRYINDELGGVNGYKIVAVDRDSSYSADKVPGIVNEFMDQGCLIFMTHSSYEMSVAQGIANDAGFPGMACYTSPVIYRPPAHIYGQAPDYGDDFGTFAKYYMDNIWTGTGQPKLVMFGLNNSTGAGALDGARAIAEGLGFDFDYASDFYEHAADTIDESTNVSLAKGKNPDLVFISSTPAPSAVIMQNLYDAELSPDYGVTVAMAHASFTDQLIELAGDDDVVEGVYGVFPTATWSDDIPAVNKAEEYVEDYNSQYIGSADYLSTWTSIIIIAEILKTALDNGVSYDTLAEGDADAWEAIEEQGIQKLDDYDVEGLEGPVSYTPGDNRLGKSLKVYKITSGSITAITEDWIEAPLIKYEEFSWWS